MSETTYDRYRRVLAEIAAGADDPEDLAKIALLQRSTPTYAWKRIAEERAAATKARKAERRRSAGAVYNKWLAAGRPPITAFARVLGVSKSSLRRALETAEYGMPWGQKRIGHGNNRNYLTNNELFERKYGEKPR